MYDEPCDILWGAGCALREIAKGLDAKHDYGLAFMLDQIGNSVFAMGSKLDKEGWAPPIDLEAE